MNYFESNYPTLIVATDKGKHFYYSKPEIILVDKPEPDGTQLRPVDVELMVSKNAGLMETLTQETIQKVYNNYIV